MTTTTAGIAGTQQKRSHLVINNLVYLAAAVVAVAIIFDRAPSTPAAIAGCLSVIAVMAVTATLAREPADLVRVIVAVTDLMRGRSGGPPPS